MKYQIAMLPFLLLGLTSFSIKKEEAVMISNPIIVTKEWKAPYNGGLAKFLFDMAKRESNNNPYVISKRGYLGKYQFNQVTLRRLGIFVPDEVFLSDEILQDSAMILLMQKNDWVLRDIQKQYNNTYYKGIYITRSGILAGAHLVGPLGLRTFFDSTLKYPTHDSNGTTVNEYIDKFGGYTFKLYNR